MSREQIFRAVNAALAPLKERVPLPDWDTELVGRRDPAVNVDPWTLFGERFRAVNGTPFTSAAALATFLNSRGFLHGYCDPGLLPELAAAFPAPFILETSFDRNRVDDYQFGITAAAAAIAETGTLVLTDAGTSRRLGALAPWVHVAVIRREQILPDIPSALAQLPADPNIVWVTGPSKTADVEGILIEGVHGPGVQAALLL